MSISSIQSRPARPKHATVRQLAKVGVELRDILTNASCIKCKQCGQTWSPVRPSGGKLPRGYWKCPNGCNAGGC
jgi:hypothetical protein